MAEDRPLVLIASANSRTGEDLAEVLASAGFGVIRVEEIGQAVGLARRSAPALVLLDVPEGDESGFRACEDLKTHRDTSLIPVVLLTSLYSRRDRVRGIHVGADRYIIKPFGREELVEGIQELLAQKEEESSGLRNELEFDMRSDERYLEQLNHLLTRLFRYTPFSDEEIANIRYALTEMGLNAIEWGNRNNRELLVKLRYRIDGEKLMLTIRDEGEGFDPNDLAHAAKPGDLTSHINVRETLGLREGGFGILVSRALMDKLEYSEKGNEVTLIKYFPERESDTSSS